MYSGGFMVSPVGFEPTTNGLKVQCSTAELQAHHAKSYHASKRCAIVALEQRDSEDDRDGEQQPGANLHAARQCP